MCRYVLYVPAPITILRELVFSIFSANELIILLTSSRSVSLNKHFKNNIDNDFFNFSVDLEPKVDCSCICAVTDSS